MLPPTMSHPLLTAREVARLLRVHPNTVYKMAREGSVPAYKVGRRYLFNLSEVMAVAAVTGQPAEEAPNP